jgi:hypothetical protein
VEIREDSLLTRVGSVRQLEQFLVDIAKFNFQPLPASLDSAGNGWIGYCSQLA